MLYGASMPLHRLLLVVCLALSVPGYAQAAADVPTPPLCIGDCDNDGAVTIDELIVGVAMALGEDVPGACMAFCFTLEPDITCLERAINAALDGCPTTCLSDQDCDAGNPCVGSRCTSSGCQYLCICD